MTRFWGLTRRNLLIYFKDVQSVVFSMLTSIIVFALYLLFLKDTFVDSIEGSMQGLEQLVNMADVDMLANGLLLVGILSSAMITVPYNCLVTIVKDRENKIDYDISATPMKRWQIILSYFTASTLSSIVMAALLLSAGMGILASQGELYLTAGSIAAMYGIVLLGAVSSTALFMLVVLFFHSSSASSAFFGMLSAAAGFVIGAYIPISQFSSPVQTFCNLFPASGITVMFRSTLLNGLLGHIDQEIGGLDQGMFVETLKEVFSFRTRLFGDELSLNWTVGYVLVIVAVCVAAMAVIYPKVYKRK